MNKTVQLKKIVIKIKDKELSLSLDEAKELKEVLGEVIGGMAYVPYGVPYTPPHLYPTYDWWRPIISDGSSTITYGDAQVSSHTTTLKDVPHILTYGN